MAHFQFKTNINCGNCLRAVRGFLDEVPGVDYWTVNTDVPEKILTVEGPEVTATAIQEAVDEAGFTAELIEPANIAE